MAIVKNLCAFGLAASLVLAGCATTEDGQRTQREGALVGAGLGALIGGLIAGEEGALIGAAVGGAAGFGVGSEIANRKEEYASAEEFYDGQIAHAQRVNRELANANLRLAEQNNQRRIRVAQMTRAAADGRADRAAVRAERAEIRRERKGLENQIAAVEKEIKIQEQVIAEIRGAGGSTVASADDLEREVVAMRAHVTDLQRELSAYADYDASLSRVL